MISVFSMGSTANGIWERGLKYPLADAQMTCDKTLGVSNEFTGCESSVEVHDGTLLIMWEEENGIPAERIRLEKVQERTEQEKARALISDMGWDSMHGSE